MTAEEYREIAKKHALEMMRKEGYFSTGVEILYPLMIQILSEWLAKKDGQL